MDIASGTQAANGSLTSTFRFTDGNDVVNGMTATMEVGDTLIDNSTTDNDVLNITATGTTAITTVNIETINFTASSGTPILNAATMSGVKNVNVTGTVAARLNDVDSAATINLAGYTRVLTINDTNYDGTTADGNPDVLNVSVSGATHGTTAATQTGITLVSANASVLETLNIASTGTAANTFTLDAGTNVTLSTVNVTGTAAATIRAANEDITGVTINGNAGTATGTVALSIGSTGDVVTNAINFSGIDDIIFRDVDTAAHNITINSVASGQKVTLASDAAAVVVAVTGATSSAPAAALTLVLDNGSANADLDVTSFTANNVTALSVVSAGHAGSTSTTAENSIGNLVGGFTSVIVTGDTSLDLDLSVAAPTSGTRTTTVDARGMTGNAFLDAAVETGNASVSYTIFGTAGNDTISAAGARSATITAGAGKDTITGSSGADTIDAGAGDDTVNMSRGADTVTLGAGTDKVVADSAVSGRAEQQTVVVAKGAGTPATDGTVEITVLGQTVSAFVDASATAEVIADSIEAALKTTTAFQGGNFTITQSTGTLTLTFTSSLGDVADIIVKAAGATFTGADEVQVFGSATDTVTVTADETVKGVAPGITTITDFGKDDVIDLSANGVLTTTAKVYFEGLETGVVGVSGTVQHSIIVLLDPAGFANIAAAEDAYDATADDGIDGVVVFLNSTLGHAQLAIDNNLGDDGALTADAVLINFTGITTVAQMAEIFSAESFII